MSPFFGQKSIATAYCNNVSLKILQYPIHITKIGSIAFQYCITFSIASLGYIEYASRYALAPLICALVHER